ncbi:MAG: intein-containing RctB family protein [Candidatus Omnitrophica bacterium]|nr:intein-containing RctB family protein [Candidatus Omnitrophota bacterium]
MGSLWNGPLEKIDDYRFRIPKSYKSGMRVDGIIYADEKMLRDIRQDKAAEQVANVAFLPGIVKHSLAMPDIHWGYGFSIGGVAATDPEEGGVISPGGVGYDINCLSADTEILTFHGYVRKIADLERDFLKTGLACMNLDKNYVTQAKISRYIKINSRNRVFKLKTCSGREIFATEDHPFWTPRGMKPLCNLKEGDYVGVYPFQGVSYEEPSSKVIIDENDIRDILLKLGKDSRGNGLEQTIKYLNKLQLLPLRYSSWQLPYLMKVMGYVFGDGTVYFNKGRGKGFTWFYGKKEDLEKIGSDVRSIGFNCSKVYSRERKHNIKTNYAFYEFSNVETSCKVSSSAFAALLVALGVPLGDKTSQNYVLPSWLWQAPLWQKRLFLASFLGAELSTPKTMTGHNYNFYAPVISMNKKEDSVESGIVFLKGLAKLLKEFGVRTTKISQRIECINANNDMSYRLRLILASTPQSMINLYSKVGFEYNVRRSFLANIATQYLKFKESVCRERNEIALRVQELHRVTGKGAKYIYREIGNEAVNLRFIERSIYGGRRTLPRVSFNTVDFIEFLEIHTRGLGNSGAVWDEVVSKEEIEYDNYVYDFTVEHPHHNFIANNFVVSNCGVRLVRTNLFIDEIKPRIKDLVTGLFNTVPAGVGSTGDIKISVQEERTLLVKGSRWAIDKGYGIKDDLECTEEGGCIEGADPKDVSDRAYERGKKQSGTLGSGNHFLEIQEVERIYDRGLADRFGLREGQITIMIHSGSRGLGYQVCDDYLEVMGKAVRKYGINLPDRQLACAPVESEEAKAYISAMRCAANYAWANRQCLMHLTRLAFERVFKKSWESLGMYLIYDVAHNIAKFEKYEIGGKIKTLCIHRKGATRAFGPGHPELPERYKDTGQPVIIPGDMGRNSFLLTGTKEAEETFYSTCHGAGRLMSRTQAIKVCSGRNIARELAEKGIVVMASGRGTLDEEAPEAYKDVNDVVKIVAGAGISKIVCRMRPLGVIKG